MNAIRPRPPSVEQLLAHLRPRTGPREHDALLAVARATIDGEREAVAAGAPARSLEVLAAVAVATLDGLGAPAPRVINATGVLIHTNLGRAAWPAAAIEAAAAAARDPLFLELNPVTGRRGPRFGRAEEHLRALTGAGAALVTNNCAAALVLALGLAGRRGIAVSRGELVEIGGGVRIPEIVRRAGVRLAEVGTTNRTRLADFEEVLRDGRAAAVLRVHRSNFAMAGFTESPAARALADLAHRHGALVIDDLGSGAILDTARFGLAHEPTPSERLADGADIVVFSGDKLIGGPQAGLLAGRADLVARIRKDPLARAMRPDKTTLAGVAATLALYRAGLAVQEIPVWRALGRPLPELHVRAAALAAATGGEVVATEATVGGGSLPGETVPSAGVALAVRSAERLAGRLRMGDPAVLARVADGRLILDLRAIEPGDDEPLAAAVRAALGAR